MEIKWKQLGRRDKIVFCISGLMVIHFTIAILTWIIIFVFATSKEWITQSDWREFLPSIIAVTLFVISYRALTLSIKKSRWALIWLIAGLLLTAACFTYEARNQNWQVLAMTKDGSKHTYCNWPLYDGPN